MANMEATARTLARIAERDMVDECQIAESGGEAVFNSSTGTYEAPDEIPVYDGKCRFAPIPTNEARMIERGGAAVSLKGYKLYLPRNTSGIEEGQKVYPTKSVDPDLVGKTLWVADVGFSTHQATRTVIVTFQHDPQQGS